MVKFGERFSSHNQDSIFVDNNGTNLLWPQYHFASFSFLEDQRHTWL